MLDALSRPWKSYQSKNNSIQVNVHVTINHFMHEEDWTKQKQNRGRSNKKHSRNSRGWNNEEIFHGSMRSTQYYILIYSRRKKGNFWQLSVLRREDLNFSLWSSPTIGATEPSCQVKSGHCSQADWGIFGRAPAVWGIWGLQRALPSPGHLSLQEPKQSKYLLSEGPSSWDISGRAQTVQDIFGRVQAVHGIFGRVQAVWAIFGRAEAVRHISVWKSQSGPAHLSGRAEAVQHISVWKSPSSLEHLSGREPKEADTSVWTSPSSQECLCKTAQAVQGISIWKRVQGGWHLWKRPVWGIFARKCPSWVECLGLEEPECR